MILRTEPIGRQITQNNNIARIEASPAFRRIRNIIDNMISDDADSDACRDLLAIRTITPAVEKELVLFASSLVISNLWGLSILLTCGVVETDPEPVHRTS